MVRGPQTPVTPTYPVPNQGFLFSELIGLLCSQFTTYYYVRESIIVVLDNYSSIALSDKIK